MAASPYFALGTGASAAAAPVVTIMNADSGTEHRKFLAYDKSFHGGVRVAMADLNNDGVEEIITAPGRSMSAQIKVFNLKGTELRQYRFTAYRKSFQGGVHIAAADVNGDGYKDLITTPDKGRAAEVRVWRNRLGDGSSGIGVDPVHRGFTTQPVRQFLAFGKTFKGGATVAAADLTGDGKAEIVVGNGPGISPHVRIFNLTKFKQTAELKVAKPTRELLPFRDVSRDQPYLGGIFVAAGNNSQIVVGNGQGGDGQVEVYKGTGMLLRTFKAYGDHNPDFKAPVHVAMKNFDGKGSDEILTSPGDEWKASVAIWQLDSSELPTQHSAYIYPGLDHDFYVA